jgi:two-component system CheB/CheR fusion protein
MRNLLNSTEIATIFVDNDLRIRRFTHEATTIINLIPTDIGRPLKHVVSNLNYDNMIRISNRCLKNLTPRETEVQTAKGEWFNMRIMPYRTTDNRIDGAVLTFSAIGDQKKAQDMLEASIQKIEHTLKLVNAVFDMNPEPMAVLDEQGKS